MFGRQATTVGKGSIFRGSLECAADDAKIAGRLEGAVTSGASVTITQDGYVEGDVSAPIVIVAGVVEGTVTAYDSLQLQPTGQILGDAVYGTLEVGRGGVVKGRTMTITSRPPEGHPAVDGTLRLTAMVEDRVTAEYGVVEATEDRPDEALDSEEAPLDDDGDDGDDADHDDDDEPAPEDAGESEPPDS
jgi:cytoskeletal protein CcmA (bactofilin family)